jgi:hypothetical protein
MENIIKSMIEKAIYYDNLEQYDEAREMLQFVRDLIEQMALTINCPSDWRNIGSELAEEYKENTWIFDELELWNYEE